MDEFFDLIKELLLKLLEKSTLLFVFVFLFLIIIIIFWGFCHYSIKQIKETEEKRIADIKHFYNNDNKE